MILVSLNATDISSKVFGLSAIDFKTNPDFTMELPEVSIQTNISTAAVNDTIYIKEDGTERQVAFYIAKISYDYQSKLYTWQCPHVLHRLTKYKCREVTDDWSDVTPTYVQYNNQTSFGQGQNRWARRYWQVLYLAQVLIHKATDIGVDSVDVSIGSTTSFYYSRALNDLSQWVTTVRTYGTLGISLPSMIRLGSQTHLDYASTDFDIIYRLPNALQLLRWVLAASGLTIDIFRTDYRIVPLTFASVPSSAATKERQDENLEPYRTYKTSGLRLIADNFDYIYGNYTDLDLFQPYTFGVTDADYELTTSQADRTNTSVTDPKELTMSWPAMFKLYFINNRGDYQSRIYYINDAENSKAFYEQWLDKLYAYWYQLSRQRRYTIVSPGLYLKQKSVSIDIANQMMTYEVLS